MQGLLMLSRRHEACTKHNSKECANDLVGIQDVYNNCLTIANSTLGLIKNRPMLTLPYNYDDISAAIKNFEMR